jgi:hypothetical protein
MPPRVQVEGCRGGRDDGGGPTADGCRGCGGCGRGVRSCGAGGSRLGVGHPASSVVLSASGQPTPIRGTPARVMLPAGYRSVGDAGTLRALLPAHRDDRLRAGLEQELALSQVRLVAVNPHTAAIIAVIANDGPMSPCGGDDHLALTTVRDGAATSLRRAGATGVTSDWLRVGGVEAVRVAHTETISGSSVQYVDVAFVERCTAYVVSFSAAAADPDDESRFLGSVVFR